MTDFTGHTVVITGGTGGLGGAIACALASCGANVAILGQNSERGQAVLAQIGAQREAAFFACDVLSREALESTAEKIATRFGKVDSLINAAGGNNPKATTSADGKFFDLPAEALRSVFDLNLLGTILPCQVFGKAMAQQGSGAILNVSSMSSNRPLTRVLAYSSAKAAVNNFTQWLAVHMAQEYSPRIRVNALAPGFFLTSQNRFLLTDRDTGELTARGKSIIAHTPMARFGEAEDLFGAIAWLLSPAAAFVTGAVIPVDGGFGAYSGV
jgi:NAD(P)-dependent dehydrogenase (short-subunit alcohol dehydrogenase family)